MVDKSRRHPRTSFRLFFVSGQSGEAISSWCEAPFECCCGHLHPSPRAVTLHPPLTWMPFKRKPVARGKRVPRAPSSVGWFFPLPELPSAEGRVAPKDCPLARVAARARLAAIGEDAQNASTLATILAGLTGVGPAEPSPRCGVRALPRHDGQSDSLAQ